MNIRKIQKRHEELYTKLTEHDKKREGLLSELLELERELTEIEVRR